MGLPAKDNSRLSIPRYHQGRLASIPPLPASPTAASYLQSLANQMQILMRYAEKTPDKSYLHGMGPLTEEERTLYAEIAETLLRGNPDLGDPEELAQSLMRRWREASLTIHRFQTSGPDNSTIIPRLAKASLSARLVPNQEASHVATTLKSFLESVFQQLDSLRCDGRSGYCLPGAEV